MEFKNTTLSEEIKNYLIDLIINKKIYKPGDKLVETKIARELNLSQAPVREAIKDLKVMGIIESQPYKGSYVKELSLKDLMDMYRVRVVLEGLGIKEAITNIELEEIKGLQKKVDGMVEEAQRKNYLRQAELDMEFHNIIIKASRNIFLKKIWNDLGMKYWIFRGLALLDDYQLFDYEKQALRHQPICEAVKQKNYEKGIWLVENQYRENIAMIQEIIKLQKS